MKVLVTGGFGYLGGRIAQYLSAQPGMQIVLGSRRPAQHATPTTPQSVQIDWRDSQSLARACHGVDVVVHTAGMNAADCAADPEGALAFNGAATGELARTAASAGVQRFIYLSTVHVYAAPLVGTFDEQSPLLNPHPYATSHAAGETAVFESAAGSGMVPTVLRLANAFGPPVDVNANCWALLLNDAARQIVETGEIHLRSAGDDLRDFVSITHVCQVALSALNEHTDHQIPILNVASGRSVSTLEMVRMLRDQSIKLVRRPIEIFRPEKACVFDPNQLRILGLVQIEQSKIDSLQETELNDLVTFAMRNFKNRGSV